jgi:hypothetical protein
MDARDPLEDSRKILSGANLIWPIATATLVVSRTHRTVIRRSVQSDGESQLLNCLRDGTPAIQKRNSLNRLQAANCDPKSLTLADGVLFLSTTAFMQMSDYASWLKLIAIA